MKFCSRCKLSLSLDDFGKNKSLADGLQRECKLCYNAKMKDYYKNNSEIIKARTKKYFEANRDELNQKRLVYRQNHLEKELANSKKWHENNPIKSKAIKSANRAKRQLAKIFQITDKEISQLYKANCFYCQTAKANHLDHVIPLARGGNHSIGNLVGACAKCNLQKNSKTVMEWKLWKKKVLC